MTRSLSTLLCLACCTLGADIAKAVEANIGVRTSVTDQFLHPDEKHHADGGHGKVFGILALQEVKSERRLVKPMDEQYLTGLLLRELAANGFRQFTKGENPDILLTVSYGRGELANPYLRDMGEVSGVTSPPTNGSTVGSAPPGITPPNSTPVPTQTIVGDWQQLFDEKKVGYQAKVAKAVYEKLFIRVTAWEFPQTTNAKHKPKPKMLWKTVIVADDPENRDLNDIAAAMLAAGAPLFDKETKDKEIDLYKPLPTGRVTLGAPEVVEPASSKK